MPIDLECAAGKVSQVSKIMKLEEKDNKAAEALATFEKQVKGDRAVCKVYQEISQDK